MRRLEVLEDRTLLNASIDIDADGLLTYKTDSAIVETLTVSVVGDVYTFASVVDIDILTNDASLDVTGNGTSLVTVTAITGLVVDIDHDSDAVIVASTTVDTAINFNSENATLTLGAGLNPLGLGDLTAPITVTGPGTATTNYLTVDDSGSNAATAYTLTATTLTADNGFGGLTYSGVSHLGVDGSSAGNEFNVQETADGATVVLRGTTGGAKAFVVEGTSAASGGSLNLVGALGANTYNILSTSSPVTVTANGGTNTVKLGDAGDTSGIGASVLVENFGGSVTINVDNSAGTTAGDWTLAMQAAPSTRAELTGFSSSGSLLYTPGDLASLSLSNAAGQDNSLTIDFDDGNPIPSAPFLGPDLTYDGGASPMSSATSNLILTGGTFLEERHTADLVGAGSFEFLNGVLSHSFEYSGISPNSVYDVVPAASYTFTGPNVPETSILVTEGANSALTGNVQALLISSPGLFTDTHVANKTNITIDNTSVPGVTDVTVNYGLPDPVEGLTTLAIATNSANDTADFVALPPGATTVLNQGGGDDQANVSVPGTAGTTEVILDGDLGDNTLTLDAGGLALDPAFFSAGLGGETVIAGIVLPGGPISYINYQQVFVTNLPSAGVLPIVTGATINAVQGQRLVDVVVATFTTTALGATAGDFTATIDNWGDGTSSAGVIVQDASNPSVFYVMGSHTYWENAPSLTTTVTIASTGQTSFTEIINGVPVTFVTPTSGTATADGTAVVDNAPISVTVNSFAGIENTTPSPLDVVVATFTDFGGVNPTDPDPAARYVATIDWGDGSGSSAIPTSAITRNGTSNSYNITLPQHVYATPGTYVVTVTVSDGGMLGAQNVVTTTATGAATIANAALSAATPQPTIVDATEGVLFVDEVVGSFTDANPLATIGEFSATIDWGDGSPLSYGRVIQPGGVGTPFFVVGTHAYANAHRSTSQPNGASPVAGPVTADGSFPIRIYVQDAHGAAVNLANTIKVLDRTVVVTGELNPASDSGASNSDGVTSVQQPNFQGVASEAGALVFLYATPFGGTAMLIGQTTADASGAWSITSNAALADGGYEIQVQAYDASGNAISALTAITPNLVIDTVGPKITDVRLDNFNGQVVFAIQDFGGVSNAGVGVLLASLTDANNYKFSMISTPVRGYRGAPQWLVTNVNVQPGTNTGEQIVTVQINDGRPLRGGNYQFNVLSANPTNPSGVRDIAGNAMDGEFYSLLPSGNNVRGGDFLARLDTVHNINQPPRTLVGPVSPASPLGPPSQSLIVGRNVPRPGAAAAFRLAARNGNHPGAADLAAARLARPRLAALMAARPRLAALLAR